MEPRASRRSSRLSVIPATAGSMRAMQPSTRRSRIGSTGGRQPWGVAGTQLTHATLNSAAAMNTLAGGSVGFGYQGKRASDVPLEWESDPRSRATHWRRPPISLSGRRSTCGEEFEDGKPDTVQGVTTRHAGRCRRASRPGIVRRRVPAARCVLRRITRLATSRSRCN